MKILFIGDVVGAPGRRAVRYLLPRLRDQLGFQVVVANGENSAGGSGITPETASELFSAGVDIITTGDHLWDQKEVTGLLTNESRFVRPVNYPPGTPGQGSAVHQIPGGPTLAVVNVQGRTFMPDLDNPFWRIRPEVEQLRTLTPIILVDIHAEATSEKIAMGRMLDGMVSAVIGTHTHVQTADERVLPGGTAYIGDVGMAGPRDGIIGGERAPALQRFLSGVKVRLAVAEGDAQFCAVIVDVDETTGRARSIERVNKIYQRPQQAGRMPALPRSEV